MKQFKRTIITTLLLGAVAIANNAQATAFDTKVQFSSPGHSTVTGIDSFDMLNAASLVIVDAGATSSIGATTVAGFFGSAALAAGDTISFDINYQSNLVGFTGASPSVPSWLDINGDTGGSSGSEVTMVLSARESAQVLFVSGSGSSRTVGISFTNMTGAYDLYYDPTANSNNVTGAGFMDGHKFLTGSVGLDALGGTFIANNTGAGTGSTFLKNSIAWYDTNYINPDPTAPNLSLVNSYFDTTINLNFGTNPKLAVGGVSGIAPYTLLPADLVLKADGDMRFQAAVPEPATILLLGAGLLGMAGVRKRRQA